MANERAHFITGLRRLADLLETVPQVPVPFDAELRWGLAPSQNDAAAAQIYEAAVTALEMQLDGTRVRMIHVHDRVMADHTARTSYEHVIQIDQEATT
jgi:ABC-type multidrug transport system fused ATPase/permease subunit